ncbi:unnamed protein product [Boreogadus saida]
MLQTSSQPWSRLRDGPPASRGAVVLHSPTPLQTTRRTPLEPPWSPDARQRPGGGTTPSTQPLSQSTQHPSQSTQPLSQGCLALSVWKGSAPRTAPSGGVGDEGPVGVEGGRRQNPRLLSSIASGHMHPP